MVLYFSVQMYLFYSDDATIFGGPMRRMTTNPPPAPRLGRPLEFRREEAVDAAMELFWRQGFKSVSASDLANAMGIQRSSFYNSFGSREAVFAEALQRYARVAPDAGLDAVPPDQPVVPVLVETLRQVCRQRAADAEGKGCLICNALAELVGVEEALGKRLEQVVEGRIALFQSLLRRAQRDGEMSPVPNLRAAAGAWVAFLTGLNTVSKVVRSEQALWGICRAFLAGQGIPADAMKGEPRSGTAR